MGDFDTDTRDGEYASEAELGPPLADGTVLGRLYRVVRNLGRGAQGDVYEVEHLRLKTRFAAKVLLSAISRSPAAIRRFEREAMAASRLEHPGIVRVLNFDETEDGMPFAVMELVDGEGLDRVIERGPMPAKLALDYAMQVAAALEVAHAANVVHRDIKPTNILVAKDGRIRVTDFGISKILDLEEGDPKKLTRTGAALGTPMYMAPEQAKAEPVDHRADMFALGLVLIEMMSGRPPSQSTNTYRLILERATQPTPDPETAVPGIARGVAAVVRRMTMTDRNARYANMREAGAAMAQAALAVEPGTGEKRAWWPWVLVGGTAVLLAMVAVMMVARRERIEPAPVVMVAPVDTATTTSVPVPVPVPVPSEEPKPEQKTPIKRKQKQRAKDRQPMKVDI